MQHDMQTLELRIARIVEPMAPGQGADIAWACVWLEACGYPGLKLAVEALADPLRDLELTRDSIGFDLQSISCVFLAPAIIGDVRLKGRVFLRNVRHGLYLLPFTVREHLGIGCPVDPAFAVGGERAKDPYAEKLLIAARDGIAVDEALLTELEAR